MTLAFACCRRCGSRLGAHPRATSSRNRALLAADTALTNHWPARRAAGVTALRPPSQQLASYYNESRIHRSLDKDAPFHRAIERFGVITSQPVLGGLIINIAESDFRYTQDGD